MAATVNTPPARQPRLSRVRRGVRASEAHHGHGTAGESHYRTHHGCRERVRTVAGPKMNAAWRMRSVRGS